LRRLEVRSGRHLLVLSPPALCGGLHCGRKVAAQYRARVRYFPPPSGGLHCGQAYGQAIGWGWMTFPAAQRRAPLRLPEALRDQEARVPPPAALRRAPLRQLQHRLHGARAADLPAALRWAPLPRLARRVAEAVRLDIFPAANRRAPLRRLHDRHRNQLPSGCSRRSAGSIAATR